MAIAPRRRQARLLQAAASLLFSAFLASTPAAAQNLSVSPVIVNMNRGQRAAVLTIQNDSDHETTFQVRGFAWSQPGGVDQIDPTDQLVVSPPLGSIAPGARQVVRLVLRRPAQKGEETYRILLDQVPPKPQPGSIAVALRFSIPIFAESGRPAAPHVRWSVEDEDGQYYLTGTNDGDGHEVVREIRLASASGQPLEIESGASPYILARAGRRWRILTPGFAPSSSDVLHLTAHAGRGAVDEAVPVSHGAPG